MVPATPSIARGPGSGVMVIRRWGGYVALTIAFAVACGVLSWWQWSRRADAVAEIKRVEVNYDAAPAALDALVPDLAAGDEDAKWRPVRLRGEYLAEEQLLVRNRPRAGGAGFEVLVPFRLDDGTVFVVDRGWVPAGRTSAGPDLVPEVPGGEVELLVRLKPGEPELPGRSAPEGQLATIHLPTIAGLVDEPAYTGMYGLLADENPAVASMPLPAIKPEPTRGRTCRTPYSGSRSASSPSWDSCGPSGVSAGSRPSRPRSAPPPVPPAAPPATPRKRTPSSTRDALLEFPASFGFDAQLPGSDERFPTVSDAPRLACASRSQLDLAWKTMRNREVGPFSALTAGATWAFVIATLSFALAVAVGGHHSILPSESSAVASAVLAPPADGPPSRSEVITAADPAPSTGYDSLLPAACALLTLCCGLLSRRRMSSPHLTLMAASACPPADRRPPNPGRSRPPVSLVVLSVSRT